MNKQHTKNNTQIRPIVIHSMVECRGCGEGFIRYEKNKGTASYYRCSNCAGLTPKVVVNSCAIT